MPDPDNVAALLPWYLNGTLSGDEHLQVVVALSGSARLRGQLEEWKRIRHMVRLAAAGDAGAGSGNFAATLAGIRARSAVLPE